MKKVLLTAGLASLAIMALVAADAKEPVLMTVNGRPVYKSEFEYLYNKNAGQQIEHQSLADYVDMFVNYKLKVADALANHYDTTATFRKELAQYRDELAAPYMIDKEAENELLDEIYNHYKTMRKVSHIMIPSTMRENDPEAIARIDSIRNEILAGRLDWNDAAKQFSIDRGTNQNGGLMGWMVVGRFPSPFEDAVYNTKVGEISEPVNSGYGYHIVRVEAEKPNPGEVKARHILKLTARKSPEEAERAKQQIDSIYTVLMGGADFAEVARAESEDPGSKANGGELDWFGAGMMVAPFDSAAFSMAEGVISHPIQTNYGWHIIEVTGHRPMKTRAEMDDQLKGMMMNSAKGNEPHERFLKKAIKRYHSSINETNLDKIKKIIESNAGGYDSVMIAQLKTMTIPVAEVNGVDIPVSDVMQYVSTTSVTDPANAMGLLRSASTSAMNMQTLEQAKADLINENAEYRNLVNEYSDGILLFDVSQDRVWQKASNDREGLENYFRKHRSQYHFDEPRYKAVVVFTTSDSLENEVRNYLSTLNPKEVSSREIPGMLRDKFGKHVRAERVIAKKGENAITDYLGFGGSRPEKSVVSWTNYFAFRGELLESPNDADDVRGKVTTDYQAELEKEWVKNLRAKYPVKIDNKVLSTVKEIPAQK